MQSDTGSTRHNSDEHRRLQRWLQQSQAAGGSRLRVGGCGHLLLSAEEQRFAQAQLREVQLPQLAGDGRAWSLLAGMAPGADLLFLDTASAWLRERRIPFEVCAVLPVPVNYLISDWLLRCEQDQQRISPAARRATQARIEAWLAQAGCVLPLFDEDAGRAQLSSRAWRQHQYRRLAALLAQHADSLLAIMRPQQHVEPGGSAEVLAWRRQPGSIPPELRLHPSHCAAVRETRLVDLSRRRVDDVAAQPADPLANALLHAESASRSGNAFACHDIVRNALRKGLRDARLDYLFIQSLANTGNTQQALEHYRDLDLGPEQYSEDWLALRGRLEKDLALRTQPASWRHYARAAEAYENAWRRHGGYYSAINAASMRMLAGQTRRARNLARQTLLALQRRQADNDRERYYQHVSAAEAALLLNEPQRCTQALQQADRLLRDDILVRSRTHQQLRLLCRQLGIGGELLDALRLPPVVLLRHQGTPDGPRRRPSWPNHLRLLVEERCLVHICLQTPADLALCEHLLREGARLYLTLPAPAPELVRAWHQTRSGRILERLQQLLNGADAVIVQRGFLPRERSWQAAEAQALNLGLSVLTAARLAMRWLIVDLQWHGKTLRCRRSDTVHEPDRQAESAFALARMPSPKTPAGGRRMAGLIFADFSGFSRLRDALFPRYYREVIGGLGHLLDRHGQAVRVRKTWGDALHVVTEDAGSAAAIAIAIQQFMEKHRLRHEGMLGDLELRVAAHYAPVFSGYDEVEHMPAHFGTQLSFAARIEPVAPPGSVYVTENFAARLTFEAPQRYALEYAGEVELAKHYGAYRLFVLRHN